MDMDYPLPVHIGNGVNVRHKSPQIMNCLLQIVMLD